MSSVIVDIIKNLIIAVVVSWITVKLSLRRFYTEKWWERKAQAYSEIIDSLAKMRIYFDKWWDELVECKKMNDEKRKKLNKEYEIAKRIIENAVAVGSFIVSEEADDVLKSFLKQIEKENIQGDWVGDIGRHYGEVSECITRLRKIAKKDLSRR